MKNWLIASAILGLGGCSVTTPTTQVPTSVTPSVEILNASQPVLAGEALTMKQIMADPAWMGTAPSRPMWQDDSASIFYQIKPVSAALSDAYFLPLNGNAIKLPLSEHHQLAQSRGVVSQDGSQKAFIYKGNLFVKALPTGEIKQLTRDNSQRAQPLFLNDGRLSFRQGHAFYALDLNSGVTQLLVEFKFAKAPKAPKAPTSYIGAQQHRLIKYVALQQHNKEARHQRAEQLQAQNETIASKPYYLDPEQSFVEAQLSPAGDKVLVVSRDKNYQWRAKHDIMPNYLGQEGYVDAVPARARVAEDKPPAHEFVLIDIANTTQSDIDLSVLPGYDEDVLAVEKAENAAKLGKKYQSKKAPRKITLMRDWTWSQSAIAWNDSGSELAIMFESVDNKDRWLTRYNFTQGKLNTLHRLHDDAWVNYTFNEFGWLNDDNSLYFLSEETGYSQLYIQPLNGKAKAITRGQFEVSSLTLSKDGQHIYYKANKAHPGKYEIYRVNTQSSVSEQLTKLEGMTDYQLSPDETKLLLSHSTLLQHTELFVKNSDGSGAAKRLTNTVSEEFANYDWQAPRIVEVPSSHGEAPVYAKVYLPQGFDQSKAEQYPAVIFNHGAGYLQNSHFGWSGYFREFMFHNLLAQQGYVVMDMDFRASKGYGRDWRTAIYRQMGTPEVQDLQDGVNYMAQHLQVDKDRVGTYGGSYGGFMTFMALFTQPDLFQAGAALRPVTDWSHYNFGYTSNILNTPNDDDIAYRRSSPIEHAQHLTKPLLIMAGVLDDNVFFQDSVRLVQRLIELEKPMFEMAIYPVEPHGFRQPSSWLDEYSRIYKLFEQNLKK
ncbi:prolyl oligopeptidase family serine peptidase [Psychrobium sp. 1_MG-2023]|uniref:S9 family peptidase n=1 Tax=Psychrobium sp. 1_MG-2023 TaxID=3062624 RepID=UPI000C3380A1|nr:prolyl oligopeptidase family serine peptidase [Psychrobium sp. 1_MG-2023]MDP2560827.1 prolyl oligopeptidase family serine peptidase [Psychrobium sp. 1_MG-2023]PKF56701.1 S9 family peptidase [Alteromonadales bacterium alter-6D02]